MAQPAEQPAWMTRRQRFYSIRAKGERIIVRFTTVRYGALIAGYVVTAAGIWVVLSAYHAGWNGNVIAALAGATISFVATIWFRLASSLVRHTLTITPDAVALGTEFQGVPVGRKAIYSRALVTDFGIYPLVEYRHLGRDGPVATLCFWSDGRSIEVESYFPVEAGIALADDLRARGVDFPRTYKPYDEDSLYYGGGNYLSF